MAAAAAASFSNETIRGFADPSGGGVIVRDGDPYYYWSCMGPAVSVSMTWFFFGVAVGLLLATLSSSSTSPPPPPPPSAHKGHGDDTGTGYNIAVTAAGATDIDDGGAEEGEGGGGGGGGGAGGNHSTTSRTRSITSVRRESSSGGGARGGGSCRSYCCRWCGRNSRTTGETNPTGATTDRRQGEAAKDRDGPARIHTGDRNCSDDDDDDDVDVDPEREDEEYGDSCRANEVTSAEASPMIPKRRPQQQQHPQQQQQAHRPLLYYMSTATLQRRGRETQLRQQTNAIGGLSGWDDGQGGEEVEGQEEDGGGGGEIAIAIPATTTPIQPIPPTLQHTSKLPRQPTTGQIKRIILQQGRSTAAAAATTTTTTTTAATATAAATATTTAATAAAAATTTTTTKNGCPHPNYVIITEDKTDVSDQTRDGKNDDNADDKRNQRNGSKDINGNNEDQQPTPPFSSRRPPIVDTVVTAATTTPTETLGTAADPNTSPSCERDERPTDEYYYGTVASTGDRGRGVSSFPAVSPKADGISSSSFASTSSSSSSASTTTTTTPDTPPASSPLSYVSSPQQYRRTDIWDRSIDGGGNVPTTDDAGKGSQAIRDYFSNDAAAGDRSNSSSSSSSSNSGFGNGNHTNSVVASLTTVLQEGARKKLQRIAELHGRSKGDGGDDAYDNSICSPITMAEKHRDPDDQPVEPDESNTCSYLGENHHDPHHVYAVSCREHKAKEQEVARVDIDHDHDANQRHDKNIQNGTIVQAMVDSSPRNCGVSSILDNGDDDDDDTVEEDTVLDSFDHLSDERQQRLDNNDAATPQTVDDGPGSKAAASSSWLALEERNEAYVVSDCMDVAYAVIALQQRREREEQEQMEFIQRHRHALIRQNNIKHHHTASNQADHEDQPKERQGTEADAPQSTTNTGPHEVLLGDNGADARSSDSLRSSVSSLGGGAIEDQTDGVCCESFATCICADALAPPSTGEEGCPHDELTSSQAIECICIPASAAASAKAQPQKRENKSKDPRHRACPHLDLSTWVPSNVRMDPVPSSNSSISSSVLSSSTDDDSDDNCSLESCNVTVSDEAISPNHSPKHRGRDSSSRASIKRNKKKKRQRSSDAKIKFV